MGMGDRAFASATELSDEIRDRHIRCVELLDFYLARAERHNPALNAIVVWQVDQARERARAADGAFARASKGPNRALLQHLAGACAVVRSARCRSAISARRSRRG